MSQAVECGDAPEEPQTAVDRLAAAVPHGVAVIRDERIAWANERLLETAGRKSPSALLGAALGELFEDTGSGLPDPGRPRAVECGLRRPDEALRTVVCRPVRLGVGPEPEAWIVEDLTHVRTLERELLEMTRKLHGASREVASLREQLRGERADREELLTVVSHELRTPVTVIRGYNRLLLSQEVGPLNEAQRRFLEESSKGCQRLDTFIGNLLEASREAQGYDVLEIGHGRLAALIEGVVEMLRPLLDERGLAVKIDVAPEANWARFDPLRIEQVLNNLLGNSLKFAKPGGAIEIATRLLAPDPKRAAQGSFVELAVADDGPGVAAEDRERIFRPYVQGVDESDAGGLGLGLAICRRLVESHGGRIEVTDRPGGGSRFAFTLPTSEEGAPLAAPTAR
ncbi:MAG: HAMP domain-containing sensor histidine kinase [Myxococcota bacterium]